MYKTKFMKRETIIILLSFIMFTSCSKESDKTTYNQNELIGVWRLNSVTFNEVDGKDINNWVSTNTILSLEDNDFFYRNYINGSWELDDTRLKLISKEQPNINTWEYEILEVTDTTIKLKIKSTEGKYCCNFEAFGSDEILTIIETYNREE